MERNPPDKSRFCVPQTQFIPPLPSPPRAFLLLDFAVGLNLQYLTLLGPTQWIAYALLRALHAATAATAATPSRFDMTQVHRFDFLTAVCWVLGVGWGSLDDLDDYYSYFLIV